MNAALSSCRRSVMALILHTLLIWSVFVSMGWAQTPSSQVTVSERAWIAAKLYSSVQLCFSHWEGVPQFDLDGAFRNYLSRAVAAPDRRAFDLASMEFMAELHNGHSGFWDDWLNNEYGQPLGFSLESLPEGWVIIATGLNELQPGDVMSQIDGQPFETFYGAQARYIAASSERSRRSALTWNPFLWPEEFELLLASGKRVQINRRTQKVGDFHGFSLLQPKFPPNVGYIAISSFESNKEEQKAVEAVRAKISLSALIIDVRGNGGGTTPMDLIRALMDRPWQEMPSTARVYISDITATNSVRNWVPASELTDYLRGQLDQTGAFEGAELRYAGERYKPLPGAYPGKVIVLVDRHCASAC